jgi:hypothetical protein
VHRQSALVFGIFDTLSEKSEPRSELEQGRSELSQAFSEVELLKPE